MPRTRVNPVTPQPPPDLWAWQIDLARNLLVHTNGLRVQFVRPDANGDWRPVPVTPLPAGIAVATLGHYVNAATQLFAARLARAQGCPGGGRRDYCRGKERRKLR